MFVARSAETSSVVRRGAVGHGTNVDRQAGLVVADTELAPLALDELGAMTSNDEVTSGVINNTNARRRARAFMVDLQEIPASP
jgi:hypothetical protein